MCRQCVCLCGGRDWNTGGLKWKEKLVQVKGFGGLTPSTGPIMIDKYLFYLCLL